MESTLSMEKQYEEVLSNFCDHGDIGDDWCVEEVSQAIITWVKSNVDFADPILSIGCGNAYLLFQLYHQGFTNVTGIDKAPAAIKLATEISHQECAKVKLEVCDVLGHIPTGEKKSKSCTALNEKFKLILDKGMFDAATASAAGEKKQTFFKKYLNNTQSLLQPKGILLIATCNWTEDELTKEIEKGYNVREVLPTPVFEFGGKKGHNVTVIAFQKKD